jgi:hypothetical protein
MNKIKQADNKRTRQINVALTEAEFLMLQVIRQKHGKTVSQLIREALFIFYANQ